LLLCALVLGGLTTAALVDAQPPAAGKTKPKPKAEPGKDTKKRPVEEMEDTPQPTPKVIRVEEEEPKASGPQTRLADVPEEDLNQAARRARHPALRKFFTELASPYDLVTFRALEGVGKAEREERVEPIPQFVGSDVENVSGDLQLFYVDAKGKRTGQDEKPTKTSIKFVRHYEQRVLDAVQEFLARHYERESGEEAISMHDQLVAAESALSAAIRLHTSRVGKQRKSEAWEPVEAALRKKLVEVHIAELNDLADSKSWDEAIALTQRLVKTYERPDEQTKIAGPLANLLSRALSGPGGYDEEQKRDVRQRLRQLEEQFPDRKIITTPIAEKLRLEAGNLLEEAKRLGKDKKALPQALVKLAMAEETWPQYPGLRAYRIELSQTYPVLRVGVRELPVFLSPAKAVTDTELRALDLLFESLVKACPDEQGVVRYRPGLAEGRPRVVPLGREFQLPRFAQWSDGQPLTAKDVRFSVSQLAAAQGGRALARMEILDEVAVHHPHQVVLSLKQGFLDPLALMTFRILPEKLPVDSERFAKDPVGSGPFIYEKIKSEGGQNYARFTANPNYGSRPGKYALPRIQEVRFYKTSEPVKELEAGQLDMVLDLTSQQAAALRKGSDGRVVCPGHSKVNRRVYFLAVNQNRPTLRSKDLRRALAHAINREKLLDDHFRGPLGKEVHQALNGPFPAHSWACSPRRKARTKDGYSSLDPFDPELAKALAQKPDARQALGATPLSLTFPAEDSTLAKAMNALCEQIKSATGIVVKPAPRPAQALRSDVEETQSYDLAYYYYDFADETYCLWPLLREGANYLGFSSTDVEMNLGESMARRDFNEVQKYTHQIHDLLSEEMPLIPLWQLDPLLAWGRQVKPSSVDPVRVFTDIEQWQLELAK
jgi:peptide/nickel transport system substrate-binding protein